MTISEYMESGLLELYALGALDNEQRADVAQALEKHAELRTELRRIELSLEEYARERAVSPGYHLRNRVLDTILNREKEERMDPADLPLLDKYSDYENWLRFVAPHLQVPAPGEQFQKVLQHTPSLTQVLVISAINIDEERHDDLHESFLILEGTCRCVVAGDVFHMKAGDFMEIPLHEMHQVEITSPVVTAIVQRVRR